jgi:hypothetical protein
MECVSSISRDGRPTRCRTVMTRHQPSVSATRQPVRMGSLWRPIRRIHSPPSIGGSTRSRNSALRWKDRASSPVPAVANTPRRQRGCAAPCCSPAQTSFCEQHLSDPYLGAPLRAPVPSLTLGSCLVPASTAVLHASLSSAFFSLRQVVISSALGNERTAKFEYVGRACRRAPVCLVRSRERARPSRAAWPPTPTTAPKASTETAPLCSGFPCSSEDPPCIIEAYSTSSSQISIHPCWSLRLSRNV